MKIRKSLVITIVVILSIIMSIGLFGVTASAAEIAASGTCGDNLTWVLDSEGLLTISGLGEMQSFSSTNSPWKNYAYSIRSVVIQDGVTSISKYAFYGCSSLTSVTLPNGITSISDFSFMFCQSLRSITIPKTVTEIGTYAFSSCNNLVEVYNLSNISISKGTANGGYVGYHALCIHTDASSKSHLRTDANGFVFYEDYDNRYLLGYKGTDSILTLPEYCNGKSYQIYKNAFEYNTNLTSVILGKGVSTIGDWAFLECSNLKSITIQNNITTIGEVAFYDCVNLENVYYTGSESDKQNISILDNNDCLINATWHLNSCLGKAEHSYTSVVTPPTCTRKGYTTYTCHCGYKYVDNYVDATGHNYDVDRIEPKCTEDGYLVYTCEECNHSYSRVYTSALGHNMSRWTVVASATCTEDGYRWRECQRFCDYREEETVPATGHNYEWIIDKPNNCGVNGIKHEECTSCHIKRNENTIEYSTGKHIYSNVCDSSCNTCGQERTAPHDYVWIIDRESNCGIYGVKHQECTLCHTIVSENTGIDLTGNHVFDSTDDMVCNVCELDFVWLHFNSNGGSYVSSIKVRLEDFNELPSSTSKSGYNFAGWSTEKNGYTEYPVGYSYYATEANATLYAQWHKHCATCSGTGKAPCYICDGDKLTERSEYLNCFLCNGQGFFPYTCPNCHGRGCYSCQYTGSRYDHVCSGCSGKGGWYEVYEVNCSQCDNNGKQTCRDCNGTGNTPRTSVSAPEKPIVESISGNTVALKVIENGEYSIDGVNWQENPIFEDLEFDKEYSFYQRYAKTDTTYTSAASEVLKVTICGHSKTEWIVDINPSCSKAGSKHEECTICKDILSTEIMEKLPHAYSSIMTNPTCTDQGYTTYTCVCGDKYVDNYADALGHNYGDWYEVTAPTCTVDGLERHDCLRCEYYETSVLNKLGHSYNSVVTAPTCTEKGYTTHTCHCGDSYIDFYVDALGHNCSEWYVVTAPTCTVDGLERRDCARCEYYETNTLGATGHTHIPEITLPTCTERGYKTYICSCGDSYIDSYITALGHSYGAWYEVVASTCTTNGSDRRDCSRCSHFETKTVDVLGHDIVHHEAQAPTCTESGWGAYDACVRCDYSTKLEISATGHSASDWIMDAEATCENNGSKHKECTVCHTILEESIIPMLTHSYVSVVTNPTCMEQGFTTHTCSECGNSYVNDYVSALGHNYGEWETTVVPTCTENGTSRHDCLRCDHYETKSIAATGHKFGDWYTYVAPSCVANGEERRVCENCEHYETNVLTAKGHNTIVDEAVESTCTSTGLTEGSHCSKCNEVFTVQTETPKKAHTYDDKYDAVCNVCGFERDAECAHLNTEILPKVDATCTTAGLTEGEECLTCGKIIVEQTVINPLGHKITTHEAKLPTCTESGWEAYETCSRCDYSTYEQLSATGHNHTSVITAPTCTEQGYTTHTCSECDDSYVNNYVSASGHIAAAPVVENSVDATCTINGYYDSVIYCSMCGKETSREQKTIAPNGHIYDDAFDTTCNTCGYIRDVKCTHTETVTISGTAATCTTTGLTEGQKCSVCGETLVAQETVAALGHSAIKVDGKAATFTADGYKAHYHCSICQKNFDEDGYEITDLIIPKLEDTVTIPETGTQPEQPSEEPKEGLSGGATAGIVVGSIAVAGAGGFSIFWFGVQKKSIAELITVTKTGVAKAGRCLQASRKQD